MRQKANMKVARGRLEEDRRREENVYEYQKVLLVMLPIIMIAVLVVGVYFGYLSYSKEHIEISTQEREQAQMEEKYSPEEQDYLLVVVNSANSVENSFVPILEEYNEIELSYLAIDDLTRMIDDAKSQGLNISVNGGYISFEEQKDIYDKAVKDYKKKKKCSTVKAEVAISKTIPNAGESEQQTGLVVDLSDGTDEKFEETAEFRWLSKNAVNYGFVLRYPEKENPGGIAYSSNLFRYVGYENALKMREYNMNFDEYVQYLNAQ